VFGVGHGQTPKIGTDRHMVISRGSGRKPLCDGMTERTGTLPNASMQALKQRIAFPVSLSMRAVTQVWCRIMPVLFVSRRAQAGRRHGTMKFSFGSRRGWRRRSATRRAGAANHSRPVPELSST
jgi:hypothetical protein